MELCMMDTNSHASAHFYQQGIESNQASYKNTNYETNGGAKAYANNDNSANHFQPETMPGPSQNILFREPQISQQPSIQYPSEIDNQLWKMESFECKQEIDQSPNLGGDAYNGNYAGYVNDYHQSSNPFVESRPFYRENIVSNSLNPYQLPASKSQIPSWYHPPSQFPPPSFLNPPQQQDPSYYSQNFYPHPQQHPYQANYIGAPSSSSSTEHNMRNMIQMTVNRNGREARNRAEKHRRDKLNGSIQELSAMVPHVSDSPRRVDKTAVLRFSAHGLRIDYVFGNKRNSASNRYLIKPKYTEGLMSLMDTFLITITCRGNIVLVSSSVEQHLGHCRSDLYGQSLLNITHPDDHALLKQQLIPKDLHTLFAAKTDENGEIRSRTKEEEEQIDIKLREDRRDFQIRLARAGPRSEPTQYELVRIDGCFRRAEGAPRGRPNTGPTGLQLIRRARGRDDNIPLHSISGNDIILIAMARVLKPPSFCDRLIEETRYEYKTRHLVDGRIVNCDQRISIVAGYMTNEVTGLSPFSFIHKDDVRWVMVALRQMYDFGNPVGDSCYRLISRSGGFIYLKSRAIMEIDEKTREVHSFICVNMLVSAEEGRRLNKEMKKKYSAIISEAELNKMESELVMDVENPRQLEKAILNLITNLNNPPYDDDDDTASESSRTTKAPLAIVPPREVSVKQQVVKAYEVISTAKGGKKSTEIKDEPLSPDACASSSTVAAGSLANEGQTKLSSQYVKAEPGPDILSPNSLYSVSSHDSDLNSPPQVYHGNSSSFANRNSRTNEYFSNYENLPHNSDPDTQASFRNSSSDSFSSNYSNYNSAPALETIVDNSQRSSVLKRTHHDANADNNDDNEEYAALLKRRLTSNDLTVSQNLPLDLFAPSTSNVASGSDIASLLSPATFGDDNLTEQFYGDIGASSLLEHQQNHENDLNAEQEEQREILQSLRESYSVIQSTSKRSES